jgi:outer membrane protein assembly factor BamB
MGGLLSTKAGLVFGGDQSTFFALDAASGRPLWSFPSGGLIAAAPVTYMVDGEQFVAVAAGGDLVAFALPAGPKRAVGALPSR